MHFVLLLRAFKFISVILFAQGLLNRKIYSRNSLKMAKFAMQGDSFSRDIEVLTPLLSTVKNWCGLNGLMYTDDKMSWTHAPLGILPIEYSKTSFDKICNLQPAFNSLVDTIARNRDFLKSHLNSVADVDPFTKRLLDMYLEQDEGVVRNGIQVGILRSDYMSDTRKDDDTENGKSCFLQVEINTIASSFGCLSQKVGSLHKYLLQRYDGEECLERLLDASDLKLSPREILSRCPKNVAIEKLAASLSFCHHLMARKDAVILFVVQPLERNVADQRALEAQLWLEHGVKVEFNSLADVQRDGVCNENGELVVNGRVVSVVYYRAGYTPNDYPTEIEWSARALIERSSAIKCPNLGYHLAGTKKIQQVLGEDGVLESLGVSDELCREMRSTFARQFSLGPKASSGATQAVSEAIHDGSCWVLKPQREGGGNNLYGEELSKFLDKYQDSDTLGGYVLMQRIFPRLASTVFFRNGEAEISSSISELGVYGTFVGDGSGAMINDYAGYLLRTKPADIDEGGVATGYSVLNSIFCT